MGELLVPRRYCGPPSSGNGGWTSGALAALVGEDEPWPAITVALRRPPPLDVAMPVTTRDGVIEAVLQMLRIVPLPRAIMPGSSARVRW